MRLQDLNLTSRQRVLVAAAAAFTVLALGYLLFGNYGDATAAMSVFHIVAFKLAKPADLPALTERFLALERDCRLNGAPYIRSLRGGQQTSPEDLHGGMQVVFLAEFASRPELEYYVFKDPVHAAFKDGLADLAVEGVTVLDFTDGVWPQ